MGGARTNTCAILLTADEMGSVTAGGLDKFKALY